METPIKGVDIQAIAQKGQAIYESKRPEYEPVHNGKFLAIEPETESVYLGQTSADALEQARQANPDKTFYVVKIGFNVADTMAQAFAHPIVHKNDTR